MDEKNYDVEIHIEMLQQNKKTDIKKFAAEINANYARYVKGEDDVVEDIFTALDKMYQGKVRGILANSGCYDDENELTAMHESHLGVWKIITECKEECRIDPEFARICSGIYNNKTYTIVRNVKRKENKRVKYHGYQSRTLESLDKPLKESEGNTTIGDLVSNGGFKSASCDTILEEDIKVRLFSYMFEKYCFALMNSNDKPHYCLALCYSRILSHVSLRDDKINERKAASPKWAINKMGQKTIGNLSVESENLIKESVSRDLFWCNDYNLQLDDSMDTSAGQKIVRDVVYTEQFNEKQIGHMTDQMHKKVVAHWLKIMKENPEVIKNAIDYTEGLHKISSILKEGVSR